jgi:glutamine amidotransferase
MCRLAAYTGTPVTLSAALFDPPHSLYEQAYRPNEMIHGTVNVDGTGVAWWNSESDDPMRYVAPVAPWQDPNLAGLAGRLSGDTLLAAVRSATAGIPLGAADVAPFAIGEYAAVHNGFIRGFRGAVGKELVSSLPEEQHRHLDTMNDSKLLFLKTMEHHDGSLMDAMRTALTETETALARHDTTATLNLVVAHRNEIVAARHSFGDDVNSLYVAAVDGGHWIASEPLDGDSAWKLVPEHHLVKITRDDLTITPLETA